MSTAFPLDVSLLIGVLDYLNIGVYVTDLDRRIVLWNRKAEEITGYRREEVVGKACRDNILCHVDKEGRSLCSTRLCPLYRAIHTERESDSPMLVYARKADGSRVAVSVSVAPLRDASGAVIGGIETFRDETASVRDLEFARTVQRHLLPGSIPSSGVVRFDARYYPHDVLGGDFYDILPLKGGRYGVLVADVRGHGISAALYTVLLKSAEGNLARLADDPSAFLAGMNRELSGLFVDESFATGFYAVVDGDAGKIVCCNAGHPPPLHYHLRDGSTTELEGHGLPLGVLAAEEYEPLSLSLEAGDMLLCYTDGITEARDGRGELLGAQRLAQVLKEEAKGETAVLLDRVYARMVEESGDVLLADDVLLLSITRLP